MFVKCSVSEIHIYFVLPIMQTLNINNSEYFNYVKLSEIILPTKIYQITVYLHYTHQASWLPPPLSFVSELFPFVSTQEVHLLLCAVTTFIKVRQSNLSPFKVFFITVFDKYHNNCSRIISQVLFFTSER